jgi:hypothetical protein
MVFSGKLPQQFDVSVTVMAKLVIITNDYYGRMKFSNKKMIDIAGGGEHGKFLGERNYYKMVDS